MVRQMQPPRAPAPRLQPVGDRLRAFGWLGLAWVSCVATVGAQPKQEIRKPPQVAASIVHVDKEMLFVDLPRQHVAVGTQLSVYRRVSVRHPLTRKKLEDRFALGKVTVVQPGDTLSIARAEGPMLRVARVGDPVELDPVELEPVAEPKLARASETVVSNAVPALPAGYGQVPAPVVPPAVTHTAEEQDVLALWRATLGLSPQRRIELYQTFLQRHPKSPHFAFVHKEVVYWQEFQASTTQRGFGETASFSPRVAAMARVAPPASAPYGEPLPLAATLRPGSDVRGVLLHVRSAGTRGYETLAMRLDAHLHARAVVPARLVRDPGLEYFVEVITARGERRPAAGSAPRPARIQVERPATADGESKARARLSSELVSFDGTSGRDWYLLSEADFLYRVDHPLTSVADSLPVSLYGIRVGYGHYRGEGGTVHELDVKRVEPEPAGFTYGFVETELRLSTHFAAAVRGIVGIGRPLESNEQRDGLTGGFQLRARIGKERGTHLVLAGAVVPEIGQRAHIALAWEALKDAPMRAEVHVTDQPVNSDELAVRLVYELGYRAAPWLTLAARASFQGRTINHNGPGLGLAAVFDW